MKILLIEDETKLSGFIKKSLTKEGHELTVSQNGEDGLEQTENQSFDLILLDIMLPGLDGFEILNRLRSGKNHTPVIFISALNESEPVIKGLDLGAVDYIKKPFDFEELKARVRNVKNRMVSGRVSILEVEDLQLDLISREVIRGDELIELSKREFSILELLMRHAGQVLSKMEITQKIWNINFDMGSNVIEVHMHQLRKKVDGNSENKLIQTEVGVGYKLVGQLVKK